MQKLKIGVLLSGSGTNLQAIIDAAQAEDDPLPVEIVQVISSRPDAFGIKRAAQAGIAVCAFDRAFYADPQKADRRIVEIMRDRGAQYLVMAGYMRKVTPTVLEAFPDRVLNLHPALLPSFKGAHAIADAFEAGVKITGVTVHLANEEYDKGPIVAQRAIDVREEWTLEDLELAIHQVEHILYPEVLRLIAQGRMTLDPTTRHVRIHPAQRLDGPEKDKPDITGDI